MKQVRRGGFTIIEVMLFLGVSGLMLAGVMLSANLGLHSQHYRDGVDELRSVIQGQFDAVANLTNNRSGHDPCGSNTATRQYRGTSDCLYVGRMLQFEPSAQGGSRLVMWPVVARHKGPASPRFNRSTLSTQRDAFSGTLSDYEIKVFTGDTSLRQIYDISWGLKAYAVDSSPRSPSLMSALLILRSPVDGAVRSYKFSQPSEIYNPSGAPRDLTQSNLAHASRSQADTKTIACLAPPPGSLWPGEALVVRIAGLATGPGDVESLASQDLQQQEGRTCRKA